MLNFSSLTYLNPYKVIITQFTDIVTKN